MTDPRSVRRRPEQFPLVRDLSTGLIHRRDCRRSKGNVEDFLGLEQAGPGDLCDCTLAVALRLVIGAFSKPFKSEDAKRERIALSKWLQAIAGHIDDMFREQGELRDSSRLTVIDGGADGGET